VCWCCSTQSVVFHSFSFRYGKFGSTPEEIEEATKSAQMHDRVMSFPDGACVCVWCMCRFSDSSWLTRLQYQSWRTWSSFEWGRETACSDRENSTEKPSYPFVGWSYEVNALWLERNQMFTPSCSALDTSTEKDIQKALQNLVQGRSSLSIAHRLSVGYSFWCAIEFALKLRRLSPLLTCKHWIKA